jgi:hypothetical protein
MNTVGEKINIEKAVCREFDIQKIHKYVAGSGPARAWSWGFNNPVIVVKDKAYRFTVQGHHHNGHVYIVLNGLDTFTIYYTSNRGTIKKISEMVYIDMLIETIDIDVERIPEYKV